MELTQDEIELIEARRRVADAKKEKAAETAFDIDSIGAGMSAEDRAKAAAEILKHWR